MLTPFRHVNLRIALVPSWDSVREEEHRYPRTQYHDSSPSERCWKEHEPSHRKSGDYGKRHRLRRKLPNTNALFADDSNNSPNTDLSAPEKYRCQILLDDDAGCTQPESRNGELRQHHSDRAVHTMS
jgi:hypothetical protein